MEKTLNEYLESFNEMVSKAFKNDNSFSITSFKSTLEKKNIELSRPMHYLEQEKLDMPWLDAFKEATSSIVTIVNNPRVHLYVYKEVVKAEQASKTDNQDIVMTSKKSSFWRLNRDDEPTPHTVYCSLYETENAIYENRFIVRLIDKMISWLNYQLREVNKLVRYIGRSFIDGDVSIADSEAIIQLAKNNKNKHKAPLLTSGDAYYLEQLKTLIKMKKDLSLITLTEFYKTVKKARPLQDSELKPTNLLVGEKNYYTCFNFFNQLLKLETSKQERDKADAKSYVDYVLLTMFEALESLGYEAPKTKIKFDKEHHLVPVEDLVFRKDHIELHMTSTIKEIEYIFKYVDTDHRFSYSDNSESRKLNKVCFILDPKLNNEITFDEIQKHYDELVRNKILKGYNNAFVVIPLDDLPNENIVVMTPFSESFDLSIKNAISSCTIFVDGDHFIYQSICPICGGKVDGVQKDDNCYCPVCESTYATLVASGGKKAKDAIWIKRIKRKEIK